MNAWRDNYSAAGDYGKRNLGVDLFAWLGVNRPYGAVEFELDLGSRRKNDFRRL